MYRFTKAMKIFAWIRRVGLNSASLNYFMVIKHSIQRSSEKALKSAYISWNNFSDLVPLTSLKCLLSSHKKFSLTRLNQIKPWRRFLADSAYLYNDIMPSNYWPKRVGELNQHLFNLWLMFLHSEGFMGSFKWVSEHTVSYIGDICNYRCVCITRCRPC